LGQLAEFWLAMAAGGLSILAILAVIGIWVPHTWWRELAIPGAAVELVLLAVLVVVWTDSAPVRPT
jgi:hypothetical protein